MNQDFQLPEHSVTAHAAGGLSSDALKAVRQGPIGVFDSGYGGLTILHGIRQLLPQYDYLYLGDNARAPYGPRSYEVVYEFTRQARGATNPTVRGCVAVCFAEPWPKRCCTPG